MKKISKELFQIANEYQSLALAEQIDSLQKEIDTTQGSYKEFIKAVHRPTPYNVKIYENSIVAPKKSDKK